METKPYWKSRRCVIVLMTFFAFMNYFSLNSNIGIVVVRMTSSQKIFQSNGTESLEIPQFVWNPREKALVLGSFAYGRFFAPVGGALANKLGGSTLYAWSVACTALILSLCPILLRFNFYLFVVAKALTGLLESFATSAISQLWSRWIPPHERARCVSVGLIGLNCGFLINLTTSGWILANWNWTALFYITSVIAFVWFLIWTIVVRSDPTKDKYISQDEIKYIQGKLNTALRTEKVSYPWKAILTCKPLWIVCLFRFSEGCIFTFLLMHLPQYIKDISNIDIKKIGYISAIPHICAIASLLIAGTVFDYIRKRRILSVTNSHKLYITISLFSGAVALIVADLWPSYVLCIVCLSVLKFFLPFAVTTVMVTFLDLAPRYASFMSAIATIFHTTGCVLTPIFVAFCVTDQSQQKWNICFITFSVIFATVASLHLIYGSGEQQHWANYGLNEHTRHEEREKQLKLLSTNTKEDTR